MGHVRPARAIYSVPIQLQNPRLHARRPSGIRRYVCGSGRGVRATEHGRGGETGLHDDCAWGERSHGDGNECADDGDKRAHDRSGDEWDLFAGRGGGELYAPMFIFVDISRSGCLLRLHD